ncbi:MAG: hypothetical protein ACRCTY_03560 [Candidatus Adiutrix sp.]
MIEIMVWASGPWTARQIESFLKSEQFEQLKKSHFCKLPELHGQDARAMG